MLKIKFVFALYWTFIQGSRNHKCFRCLFLWGSGSIAWQWAAAWCISWQETNVCFVLLCNSFQYRLAVLKAKLVGATVGLNAGSMPSGLGMEHVNSDDYSVTSHVLNWHGGPIRCWGMQTNHSSMDLFTLPQKKEIVLFLLVLCNSLKIPLKKCNFELSLVFSSIDCFNSYVMVQNDILKSNTGIWLFFRDLIQSWLPWWCF